MSHLILLNVILMLNNKIYKKLSLNSILLKLKTIILDHSKLSSKWELMLSTLLEITMIKKYSTEDSSLKWEDNKNKSSNNGLVLDPCLNNSEDQINHIIIKIEILNIKEKKPKEKLNKKPKKIPLNKNLKPNQPKLNKKLKLKQKHNNNLKKKENTSLNLIINIKKQNTKSIQIKKERRKNKKFKIKDNKERNKFQLKNKKKYNKRRLKSKKLLKNQQFKKRNKMMDGLLSEVVIRRIETKSDFE